MKKFLIMIAMMLYVSTAIFAGNIPADVLVDKTPVYAKNVDKDIKRNYNFSINYGKLYAYLELAEEDTEMVRQTYSTFSLGMRKASEAETEEARDRLIFNSITYALKNMQYYLTYEQYRKFLRVLNISLVNKGFSDIICNYEDRKNS